MSIKILFFLALATVVFSSQGCDGECDPEVDLHIPPFINGTVFVESSYNYTLLGNQHYPLGVDVYRTNGNNRFYSIDRTNPVTGSPIRFYWSNNFDYPFTANSSPPFHPIDAGETVNVYQVVFNNAPFDFDCLTDSKTTTTDMRVSVTIENGQIVDQQQNSSLTPSIKPGEYEVMSFPVAVNELGDYELKFKVNYDLNDLERDTANNTYIIRTNDQFTSN